MHKFSAEFAGIWAYSTDYSYCILFEFVATPEANEENAISLLNLGEHADVY